MIRNIKRILIVVVIVIIGALCLRYWRYIWPVVTGIVGLLFISQGGTSEQEKKLQKIQEKEKEIDQAAGDRRQRAETLAREDEEQQAAIEDWRERKNRWKSRGSMMLVLCMLLVAATPAWAGADLYSDFTREELIEALIEAEKLLDEADQHLARETVLKEEYKQLYLEAEADLWAARELSGQKDEIIAIQNREIELLRYQLERSNQAWGLTGGMMVTGQAASWTLGVSRRRGSLSWTLAVAGGDSFGVGVTVWW